MDRNTCTRPELRDFMKSRINGAGKITTVDLTNVMFALDRLDKNDGKDSRGAQTLGDRVDQDLRVEFMEKFNLPQNSAPPTSAAGGGGAGTPPASAAGGGGAGAGAGAGAASAAADTSIFGRMKKALSSTRKNREEPPPPGGKAGPT